MNFMGYERANGTAGIRNFVVAIPVANCGNDAVFKMAKKVAGVVPLCHSFACAHAGDDVGKAKRGIIGLGANANVFAALIVAFGCEPLSGYEIADEIAKTGKPVLCVCLEDLNSYELMMEKGIEFLKTQMAASQLIERHPCDISNLMIGLKCCGSGAISILSNNLVCGRVADMLIDRGGSAIFGETSELLGVDTYLKNRSVDRCVADKFSFILNRLRNDIDHYKVDIVGSDPSSGNIKNGLSTIEEKALGNIAKIGTKPIMGALEFGETPSNGRGLYFMDCDALIDSNFVGFMSAGSQFGFASTSGGIAGRTRTTPSSASGVQIYPAIKVLGSNKDKDQIKYYDAYVGDMLEDISLDEAGERLFKIMLDVASGKLTYAEENCEYYATLTFSRSGLTL